MNERINCCLLISTYNWPEALNLCLKSVKQQSILPNEIIIADDGSSEETAILLDAIKNTFPVPVTHVWQPDEGFQKTKILNKAIAKVNYDYIIQIDGDIIIHKDFIKDHLNLARPGTFVTGSRILLGHQISKEILDSESIVFNTYNKGSKNFFNGVRIPFIMNMMADNYKTRGKHTYDVRGCNMAFWLNDLIKVNGYNEIFTGWGREDSELAIRLINSGIKKRFIKMGGICYHLYHKKESREWDPKNTSMMNEAIQNRTKYSDKGLSQYL